MVGQQPNPCWMEPPQGQQYPQPSHELPAKPKDDNTNIGTSHTERHSVETDQNTLK